MFLVMLVLLAVHDALKRKVSKGLLNTSFSHLNRETSDSRAAVLGKTVTRWPEKSRRSVKLSLSENAKRPQNVEQSAHLSRQAFKVCSF
jgi:hypothetical protein